MGRLWKKFMQQRFNPTLSWDGVSMILACVGCSLWFGSLSETVKQHSKILENHEQNIRALTQIQQVQSQNIAVLQTIVETHLKNSNK